MTDGSSFYNNHRQIDADYDTAARSLRCVIWVTALGTKLAN
jgi:hypothetical protein